MKKTRSDDDYKILNFSEFDSIGDVTVTFKSKNSPTIVNSDGVRIKTSGVWYVKTKYSGRLSSKVFEGSYDNCIDFVKEYLANKDSLSRGLIKVKISRDWTKFRF